MLLRPFNAQLPSGSPQIPANAPGWHYLHDVLGSVIGMVDATGQLVERYTYDPYGKPCIDKWGNQRTPFQDPIAGPPCHNSPVGRSCRTARSQAD